MNKAAKFIFMNFGWMSLKRSKAYSEVSWINDIDIGTHREFEERLTKRSSHVFKLVCSNMVSLLSVLLQ